MRNGMKATIVVYRPGTQFCWIGWVDGHPYSVSWKDGGQARSEDKSDWDIISPWTPTATGHNPDNLTEEQVGVKDGWRLLDLDEIKPRKLSVAESWLENIKEWSPHYYSGSSRNITYRTKFSRSKLAALDKLKKRLIRVEELPAVCWVMEGSSMSNQYLLSYRNNSSNHIGIGGELAHHLSYYKDKNFQWSSDLKNWNSFEVEDK